MGGKAIKVEYNGVNYSSLRGLCRELDLSYSLIESRIRSGWSLEDAVNKPKAISKSRKGNGKPFSYKGKEYRSISSFCKENGLIYPTVKHRIESGWSFEDAISKPKIKGNKNVRFKYNGKEYRSISSFCKEHDLSYSLVRSRLRQGWNFEDAISKSKQKHIGILYKGRFYKTIAELTNDVGINIHTFKRRLNLGNSIEECVVLQDISLKRNFDNFYECKCKHCGLKFIGTLEIAEKHASEHKEDYENIILNRADEEIRG